MIEQPKLIRQSDVLDTRIEGIIAQDSERKNIAFLLPIEGEVGFERIKDNSPSILQFVQHLKNCGHNVDFYINSNYFYEMLHRKDYDVAAFSGTANELETILELAGDVKSQHPKILTAVGGYVAKGYYWALPYHAGIDIAVEGEAEILFPLILKTLGKKQPLDNRAIDMLLCASATRVITTKDGRETKYRVPLSKVSVKHQGHAINLGSYDVNHRVMQWHESPYPTKWELDKFFDINLGIFKQREMEHTGFNVFLDLLYPQGIDVRGIVFLYI